ncbi:DUF5067 domain-containing protein [Listeria sp. FSL L7-1517]|uniref:DUF5067 domain-containing protein n=1 Tax=Listeria TaxID=1637 RepID=UPI0010F37D04|nr:MULTISPECIES: DUF5067 domain-containing protein [Listeria]EAC7653688.1 DUF5067 domain-containing protein [Listeria monocytogenes]MBC1462129.1 DUF5067 domain-containing protein [Listeria welshimeri]MBC2272434.1 DUF5067 domain-containing protein [Listeria welshimeri]MBC2356662.1 DUF5067 domain-containing protein [Listeria welshimeri]MBC6295535.1 DUF5067 domain-containing protein [Listeria immobilis]
MKKGIVLLTGFLLAFSIFLVGCGKQNDDIKASKHNESIESNEKKETKTNTFKNGILENEDVKITITSHKVIPVGEKGNEYGDKPVIAFWYDITNKSGSDITPLAWIDFIEANQDNNPNQVNKIDVASLPDDKFLNSQMEDIKKGGTAQCAVAYYLDDKKTPVELIYLNMGTDEIYGKTTYDIK